MTALAWSEKDYQMKVTEPLKQLADCEYQAFTSRLLPVTEHILGVRLPNLHKLAKKIGKEDWQGYLKKAKDSTFEEIMLQGMVIGEGKGEFEEIIPYIKSFVPKIHNWSVCDSFCTSLKITKKNKEDMWKLLVHYFESEEEFELRFAVVMFLIYYVDAEYLSYGFTYFDKIPKDKYYVSMAVAWAVSVCFIHYEIQTFEYLNNNKLDLYTYNRAIQKIIESNRVNRETKEKMRDMKRKLD